MKDYHSMLNSKVLSYKEKYEQLKKHTEDAGMTVEEVNGKIVVKRIKK
jgi:hypothetical protein